MSVFDTFLNWGVFRDTLPLLLSGLWVTIGLGLAAIGLGASSPWPISTPSGPCRCWCC